MARIINWIKKMCRRQESPGEQLMKTMLQECPEAVGPTGIIDLKKVYDILDEKRVRTIEQMIVLKFTGKGDISLKQYLDFEGYPHSPEFYEENWNDYDVYISGFCVIGNEVYIFDDEAKRHPLSSQRTSWIEKFSEYINNEDNLIFETTHTTEEDIRILAELKEELSRSEREETLNKLDNTDEKTYRIRLVE